MEGTALRDGKWPDAAQDEDCASPSTSSAMPAEDMREMLTAVAQHSDLAAALRLKGQAGRAVRTLERAVAMCSRAEHVHPAIAVEAARARINLAGALSEVLGSVPVRLWNLHRLSFFDLTCGEAARHREAIAHVRKAQRGLDQVLAWADHCGASDPGVFWLQTNGDLFLTTDVHGMCLQLLLQL